MKSIQNNSASVDDTAYFTLELDDGETLECEIVTIFSACNKDYIALLPLNDKGENEDGEVYLYRYVKTPDGPSCEYIEDDEEYEIASDAFDEWLDEQEYDELVMADEE